MLPRKINNIMSNATSHHDTKKQPFFYLLHFSLSLTLNPQMKKKDVDKSLIEKEERDQSENTKYII